MVFSRRANGLYLLTKDDPIAAPVNEGHDLFVPIGDPIGFQPICQFGAKMIFHAPRMQRMMAIRVDGPGFFPIGEPYEIKPLIERG